MEMVHFIPPCQRRLAFLAAQTDSAPVLISGASGTGKGAISRWIHSHSPRAARPFLIAHQGKPLSDQIVEARNGTLMIPEIGEWTLSEQKILLDYLKTKSVPSSQAANLPELAYARIIGTTSHTLEGRAQGGLFNIELFEKLNVFRIEMPPLIKRTEELDDIFNGILQEITRELRKEHLQKLSPKVLEYLRSYEWPGNIRELRNVLRLAVIAAKGHQVEMEDLPDFTCAPIDFRATREQFEKVYILELLKTFNWEIDKTCRMTRMDKNILLSKIKHYGITVQTESIS